jgi:hypothetical protein
MTTLSSSVAMHLHEQAVRRKFSLRTPECPYKISVVAIGSQKKTPVGGGRRANDCYRFK